MRKTNRIIRSMDGPIRVLGLLLQDLRKEIDKTSVDLQEEFPIVETGVEKRWPVTGSLGPGGAER